jgi:putative addiction module killer protein
MIDLKEFLDDRGRSPFQTWFNKLDPQAAAKMTVAIVRLQHGNVSNTKSIGGGVLEYRIDFGPGYRIYFGRDGEEIVILLGGGTKKRQQTDIEAAKQRWLDYKMRKKR